MDYGYGLSIMLSKLYRLNKKRDFHRIYLSGNNFKRSFFNIRILQNNLDHVRIGIVIPNKACKKSSKRNRFKRILSEIIRKNPKILAANYDIIIYFWQIPDQETKIKQIEKDLGTILGI